jgi:DNA-binding MarR family transcriptional regulator
MHRAPRRFYMIKQIERLTYQRLDEALRQRGLTPTQYMVLSLSHAHGEPQSSADLARRARTSAQSMNEIIAALEAKALIERHEDPDRRRILRVSLTRAGKAALAACDKDVDALEAEFFAVLTPGENALLRELLGTLLRGLRRDADSAIAAD